MTHTVSVEPAPDEYDPFNPVPEPEQDKEALIRSLTLARNWGLYFVVCNSSDERERLMNEVAARLPGKNIQCLPVAQEVGNLVDVLREKVASAPPDILFIYGLERWLSGSVNPRSVPFLLNLNAARDLFPEFISGPMVLWLPQFALEAVANAAPDFFSVRSGIYTFPLTPEERLRQSEKAHKIGQYSILQLQPDVRSDQILQMESVLSELRTLPSRDLLDEAIILNRIGLALQAMGKYQEAECKHKEALQVRQALLPEGHELLLKSVDNIATVYELQKRYTEAENLFALTLESRRQKEPQNKVDIARALNNLGHAYYKQGKIGSSLGLLTEAMELIQVPEVMAKNPSLVFTILNSLSVINYEFGMYGTAEQYARDSLHVNEGVLGRSHPSLVFPLLSLAHSLEKQGRMFETEQLYRRAVKICRLSLDDDHPNRVRIEGFYAAFTAKHKLRMHTSIPKVSTKGRTSFATNGMQPMQPSSKNKRRK